MPQQSAHTARRFDPATVGTAERRWTQALSQAAALFPPPGPLLVVSPHPDDEVLGAGGLMRWYALAGRQVAVLSVTSGEAAYSDWPELSRVRRRELDQALRALAGGRITTLHLGIPDGRVKHYRLELTKAIRLLTIKQPTVIAPYELDGHPDHDVTGEICRELASARGLTVLRYPIWTWHHAAPEVFSAGAWVRFSLDEATQAVKRQAIQCFASQLRPRGRAPIVPSHVVSYFERSYEAFLR